MNDTEKERNEYRLTDEREHIIHANFNSNGCGCKGRYYINFSQKYLDNTRDDMTELCINLTS